jgi:hypothetical protein
MHHFVIQVVFNKPASVTSSYCFGTVFNREFKILVRQLLYLGLNKLRNSPKQVVSSERNLIRFCPCQNPINYRINRLPFLALHICPFNCIVGYCRVKIRQKLFFELFFVVFRHRTVSKTIWNGTSKPELMGDLFYNQFFAMHMRTASTLKWPSLKKTVFCL